ncbi:MAG: flippase-like domain-containing protein [Desulfobacterales bacterium]|jgi:hypothetical protein|nr:flippase-like domain-containing protein [Desulfobacterales bacterium]
MIDYSIRIWQSKPWIRQFIKLMIIGLPFYFMSTNLYLNWQSLQKHHWALDPLAMVFSALFLFAAFLLLPLSMRQVMLMLNYELSYLTAYRAYFLSQLAKYLPGGIWIVPGRMIVLKQMGVSAPASSLGALVEVYIMVITGLFLFILYSIFTTNCSLWRMILLFLSGFFLLLPVLYKPFLFKILKHIPWFRSIEFHYDASMALQAIFITIAFWVLIGTGFFFLVRSMYVMDIVNLPAMIAIYSMSWVSGFLIFITPGGLGVREGALSLLLSTYIPLPISTLIALLSRVWWSIAEILFVSIASLGRVNNKV